ncbi:MAG TPA: amidohydrolase [Gemmatimonadota bacterium]|nr:amidohydrolase [Gemmatimonadota bacterium]
MQARERAPGPIAVSERAAALEPEIVAIRRDLHRHPELGFEEIRTAEIVAGHLRDLGIEVRTRIAGTGVAGILRNESRLDGGPTRTVLLRADMDALPIDEENEHDYRSTVKGRMHACGHDGHTAILLGVARLLAEDPPPGNVVLAFQPAEEKPGGAQPMIAAGVLADPPVDAALGLHLWTNLPVGTVGLNPGPLMAGASEFRLTIAGSGGHAALPHQAVDSVVVASHIVVALQTLISRETNPLEPAVVSVGSIHGGTTFNVIAARAVLEGTVRAFDDRLLDRLRGRIESLADGIARGMGAGAALEWTPHYPPTVNDPAMAALVAHEAAAVVGKENVFQDVRTMGAEDMSYFLQAVPGCFFFVGAANPAKGITAPHHSPRFDIDEAALPIGAEILSRAARAYLAASSTTVSRSRSQLPPRTFPRSPPA